MSSERLIDIISILSVAFCVALVFTPVAIWLAKKIGVIDIPKDDRRMHKMPIPRMGGLAIYIGTLVAILVFVPVDRKMAGLLIGGTVIFLIGIIDDIKNLSAKVKLVGQIGCAGILYYFGVKISYFGSPWGYVYFTQDARGIPGLELLITIIWVVGITNTINLIDGLDGLAAGTAAIASTSIAYAAFLNVMPSVGLATVALAGAALGFLPFNFNPAKIFMGDGGSLFLGFMLAGLSMMGLMKGATAIATIVPLFVLGLPIFDTGFAILRRLINKRPIMEADKGHLHHRIMAKGLGQKRTVILLYSMSALLGVAAILISKRLVIEASVLFVITAALIYVFIKDQAEAEKEEDADIKIYKR